MIRTAAFVIKPETLLTEAAQKSDFILFIYFSFNLFVLQINVIYLLICIIIIITR